MQILTDILSLLKRKKFVKNAKPKDVLVLGIHEEPEITGVASPVPYKDVKLIQVKDLTDPCEHKNLPLDGTEAGVFYGEVQDPNDSSICYTGLRRLKSLSLNLTIVENDEYIEFDATGEANTGENVGTGVGVFKDKLGEVLRFRTIKSPDNSISVTLGGNNNDEIHISSEATGLIELEPFNITAGAGGSSTMPSNYNLIDISWDGLGNGTYTLNLPSASSLTHRNIRIITDGSLDNGAQDKIFLTPPVGETIDGAADFELSKRYEGVSIWSDGTEWIVIQAKAH